MTEMFIEVDQSEVFSMVDTFTHGIVEAERFVAKEIENVIRYNVFDEFIRLLTARAGPGWNGIYTDHLIAVLKSSVPVFSTVFEGQVEVTFDLDGIGDYNDLEAGAHYGAITEGNEDGHIGVGKTSGTHHGLNPHPARIELPYEGEDMINYDPQDRLDFWEQVVIGRDMSFPLKLRKGKDVWTYEELAAYMGYPPVPTYTEIAFQRTLAWGSKAPQWLWLENGFTGSDPEIYPVDFINSIENVVYCIAGEIYESEVVALVKLADEKGARINAAGRPYEVIPGRGASYVRYREGIGHPDIHKCFGRI